MSTMNISEASKKLSNAIQGMRRDDLVEVYNEMFPATPVSENQMNGAANQLSQAVLAHITRGLEPEEVVDLWNVVFPADRNVYFDEEDNLLHVADPVSAN